MGNIRSGLRDSQNDHYEEHRDELRAEIIQHEDREPVFVKERREEKRAQKERDLAARKGRHAENVPAGVVVPGGTIDDEEAREFRTSVLDGAEVALMEVGEANFEEHMVEVRASMADAEEREGGVPFERRSSGERNRHSINVGLKDLARDREAGRVEEAEFRTSMLDQATVESREIQKEQFEEHMREISYGGGDDVGKKVGAPATGPSEGASPPPPDEEKIRPSAAERARRETARLDEENFKDSFMAQMQVERESVRVEHFDEHMDELRNQYAVEKEVRSSAAHWDQPGPEAEVLEEDHYEEDSEVLAAEQLRDRHPHNLRVPPRKTRTPSKEAEEEQKFHDEIHDHIHAALAKDHGQTLDYHLENLRASISEGPRESMAMAFEQQARKRMSTAVDMGSSAADLADLDDFDGLDEDGDVPAEPAEPGAEAAMPPEDGLGFFDAGIGQEEDGTPEMDYDAWQIQITQFRQRSGKKHTEQEEEFLRGFEPQIRSSMRDVREEKYEEHMVELREHMRESAAEREVMPVMIPDDEEFDPVRFGLDHKEEEGEDGAGEEDRAEADKTVLDGEREVADDAAAEEDEDVDADADVAEQRAALQEETEQIPPATVGREQLEREFDAVERADMNIARFQQISGRKSTAEEQEFMSRFSTQVDESVAEVGAEHHAKHMEQMSEAMGQRPPDPDIERRTSAAELSGVPDASPGVMEAGMESETGSEELLDAQQPPKQKPPPDEDDEEDEDIFFPEGVEQITLEQLESSPRPTLSKSFSIQHAGVPEFHVPEVAEVETVELFPRDSAALAQEKEEDLEPFAQLQQLPEALEWPAAVEQGEVAAQEEEDEQVQEYLSELLEPASVRKPSVGFEVEDEEEILAPGEGVVVGVPVEDGAEQDLDKSRTSLGVPAGDAAWGRDAGRDARQLQQDRALSRDSSLSRWQDRDASDLDARRRKMSRELADTQSVPPDSSAPTSRAASKTAALYQLGLANAVQDTVLSKASAVKFDFEDSPVRAISKREHPLSGVLRKRSREDAAPAPISEKRASAAAAEPRQSGPVDRISRSYEEVEDVVAGEEALPVDVVEQAGDEGRPVLPPPPRPEVGRDQKVDEIKQTTSEDKLRWTQPEALDTDPVFVPSGGRERVDSPPKPDLRSRLGLDGDLSARSRDGYREQDFFPEPPRASAAEREPSPGLDRLDRRLDDMRKFSSPREIRLRLQKRLLSPDGADSRLRREPNKRQKTAPHEWTSTAEAAAIQDQGFASLQEWQQERQRLKETFGFGGRGNSWVARWDQLQRASRPVGALKSEKYGWVAKWEARHRGAVRSRSPPAGPF